MALNRETYGAFGVVRDDKTKRVVAITACCPKAESPGCVCHKALKCQRHGEVHSRSLRV